MGAGVLDMKSRLAKETTWIDIIIVEDDPKHRFWKEFTV